MANPTPWKTNDWFVSEWNYAPEVTKDFKFAKNIKIHDVTLRDGEQQTGVILSKDEKIRIAEALAEAGVHRIEAGMPIVSPSDNAAIKEIVKRNLGPQIFSFARCMKEDVQARGRHRRQRRRHGNPLVQAHARARLPLAAGKGDRDLGRGHRLRAQERPRGGVLPHRLLARRAQMGDRPDREASARKATWTRWRWSTPSACCRRTP